MEPLIRRSAALAAQLAGDFMTAVVEPSPPPDGVAEMLAGYEELTTRLGGQFTVLDGPPERGPAAGPAATLAAFARQHKVTEMVLARGDGPAAGRRPVLRDLSRGHAVAEVHVLPVLR
jgi:K+-sensing histidine kinase KdpD